MDSLTHLVAGACIAAAIAPPAHRRLALLAGAALGTLPDLDYLWLAFVDPVERFVGHRGPTHSLLVLPFVALACWWLMRRLLPATREAPRRWPAAAMFVLLSHPMLDAMTVYGTRLFWPLDDTPVMHANLFIIDPLVTLPLAIATVAAWVLRERARAQRVLVMGLALSCVYIGWSLLAKQHLEANVRAHFAARGAPNIQLLTVPTPFNTIVWRVLVMSDGAYGEGYHSFLGDGRFELQTYPGERALPPALETSPKVALLKRFTRGYYRIDRDGERYVFVDLRMGAEPDYVFRFAVGTERDGAAAALEPPEQYPWPRSSRAQLAKVWDRMFASTAPARGDAVH